MGIRCFIAGCERTKYKNPEAKFVEFPKNEKTFICDLHFPKSCFGKKKLRNSSYSEIAQIIQDQNLKIEKNVNNKNGCDNTFTKKRRTSSKKCIIENCKSTNISIPKIGLFKFPREDSDLYKIWLAKCKLCENDRIKTSKYVCGKHFDSYSFIKKKLKKTAYPNYNLPLYINTVPNDSSTSDKDNIFNFSKSDENSNFSEPFTRNLDKSTYSFRNSNCNTDLTLNAIEHLPSPARKRKLSSSSIENTFCEYCLKNGKDRDFYAKKCTKLQKQIRLLENRNKHLLLEKKRNYSKILGLRKTVKIGNHKDDFTTTIDKIEHINNDAKTLIKMLVAKRRSSNIEYPSDQKNLAMNIHYESWSTYVFLRDRLKLNLPSDASIYRWTPIKHLTPGFNQPTLDALSEKIITLDQASATYDPILSDPLKIQI